MDQNKETPTPSSDSGTHEASKSPANHPKQAMKDAGTDETAALQETENLPEPARKMFQMQMAMMQSFSKKMPSHPLLDKLTPEHIDKLLGYNDKLLDYNHEEGKNNFHLARSNRWFHLAYTIIGVGSLLFLIFYLAPTDKEFLTEFLKLLIVFASGVGSGYGLKSYQEKKR